MFHEWRDFSTDSESYSKQDFEALVNDEFVAMMFLNDEIPAYIWTTNYVCVIQRSTRMIDEISITKIPRNPVCA
ncbi:hypothetical protein [Bacillus suaedae]|uniref:Uncharacterized protein n=1 Tax=Halalkalibacter suaedae TaxID=2822140 RepID=A0A941ANX3_9BACI|nr:hypothetical protein [Bacillus suaedae]MBP3950832.1 hypothetical protein [Bacillus suaedae]